MELKVNQVPLDRQERGVQPESRGRMERWVGLGRPVVLERLGLRVQQDRQDPPDHRVLLDHRVSLVESVLRGMVDRLVEVVFRVTLDLSEQPETQEPAVHQVPVVQQVRWGQQALLVLLVHLGPWVLQEPQVLLA